MARHYSDWLSGFVDYCSFTEAPSHMHYWAGVSTIAGALGRKSWLNMRAFNWFPNQYIVLVGPPEVIQKSTTMGMGMQFLKRLDKEMIGPSSCTWPALLKYFEQRECKRDIGGEIHNWQYATCSATELGTFLKTDDKEMVDILINLWDGSTIDKQIVKEGGTVYLEEPLLNLNGCTTPEWVSRSITLQTKSGGLFTRVIFVYADTKRQFVAYPDEAAPADFKERTDLLYEDLIEISKMEGEWTLSPEARLYGREWYDELQHMPEGEKDILARKQSHVHKLAMAIAASHHSRLIIEKQDLQTAVHELSKLDAYRQKVLESVGRHSLTGLSEEIIDYIARVQKVEKSALYRKFLAKLPNKTDFDNVLSGIKEAGYVETKSLGDRVTITSLRGRG